MIAPPNATPRSESEISWRENSLLAGLDARDLLELEGLVTVRVFAPFEPILAEGETGDEMFLVEAGSVEVSKEGGRFVIASQVPGESFGTIALVDNEPRSASVRAGPAGCRAAVMRAEGLRRIGARGGAAEATVLRNMLRSRHADLRRANVLSVSALERELEASRARLALGSFVGYVLVIMCFYGFALRESLDFVHRAGSSTWVTAAILVVYGATLFLMMKRSGYPLEVYGLTLGRWPRVVVEAVLWTLPFLAVLVLLKGAALVLVPEWSGAPLFRLAFLHEPLRPLLEDALLYGLFAPVQELVARGALQGSLMNLLSGRAVTARAILVSTLAFTATHLHLSIGFALAAAVPSVFWGLLFARQRSLVGVSVSHLLLGWFAVYVLGVPGVS